MTTVRNSSQYSVIGPVSARQSSQYTVNGLQTAKNSSQYDVIVTPQQVRNSSQYDVNGFRSGRQSGGNARVFTLAGRRVFARNTVTNVDTDLGFIPEGSTTLTDVSLADGNYELRVETSNDFWIDAKSKVRFVVEIASGVVGVEDIPNIENLLTVITSQFQTSIRWSIPDVSFASDMEFSIWRSTTSPVDVSGTADFTTPAFAGVGNYRFTLDQTEDEFFAVAGTTTTEQGQESEVFQDWDLTALDSPPDQFAIKS